MNIAQQRMIRQRLVLHRFDTPSQVVSYFGAVQAQDYPGALWGIGRRIHGGTNALVERAVADRSIVRTWPMRGTLHFVAAEDVRWMLELLTPKVVRGAASRLRQLELDDRVFGRCGELFTPLSNEEYRQAIHLDEEMPSPFLCPGCRGQAS